MDADRATDAEGGTDEHEEGGTAGGLTATGGDVDDHDEGERAAELPVEDWSPQAIVLNRSDLMDLRGPSLGGLMGASDYWFTASPYTAFFRLHRQQYRLELLMGCAACSSAQWQSV